MIFICGEFVLIIFVGGSVNISVCLFVNSSGWILSVGVVKFDESLLYTWSYIIDWGIRNGFDFEKT